MEHMHKEVMEEDVGTSEKKSLDSERENEEENVNSEVVGNSEHVEEAEGEKVEDGNIEEALPTASVDQEKGDVDMAPKNESVESEKTSEDAGIGEILNDVNEEKGEEEEEVVKMDDPQSGQSDGDTQEVGEKPDSGVGEMAHGLLDDDEEEGRSIAATSEASPTKAENLLEVSKENEIGEEEPMRAEDLESEEGDDDDDEEVGEEADLFGEVGDEDTVGETESQMLAETLPVSDSFEPKIVARISLPGLKGVEVSEPSVNPDEIDRCRVDVANIVAAEWKPYDHETIKKTHLSRSSASEHIPRTVIRWRRAEDGTVQSNAKVVVWPDGSRRLYVGSESFDMQIRDLHRENYHVFYKKDGIDGDGEMIPIYVDGGPVYARAKLVPTEHRRLEFAEEKEDKPVMIALANDEEEMQRLNEKDKESVREQRRAEMQKRKSMQKYGRMAAFGREEYVYGGPRRVFPGEDEEREQEMRLMRAKEDFSPMDGHAKSGELLDDDSDGGEYDSETVPQDNGLLTEAFLEWQDKDAPEEATATLRSRKRRRL